MKPSNAKVKWKTEVDTNIQNGVIYKKRTNKLKFKSEKHQIIKINQNYIIDSCTVCSINGNFSHVIADIINFNNKIDHYRWLCDGNKHAMTLCYRCRISLDRAVFP